MGIFDIGDFITLGLVGFVFVVMRRFDQHNRSLDGVKRFFDKTRIEFDAYMRRNQEHLHDLSNEISSYDKTSKEVLRRIEIDARDVREQAENLNQVKTVMVELLSVRDNVMESLENLKEDATYITEMSRRVEVLEQKIQQVEASGDRLLLELAERNEKSLVLQRKSLDIVFEKDRETLQNELQKMSVVASDLHQELDNILVQKEEILVRNLRAYSHELDRVSDIYTQKLHNLESAAMQMETEGLLIVKQNLDNEFEKIKENIEKMFLYESLHFKNDLEIQTDSFKEFLNQYDAIEVKIEAKFNELTNRGQILSDQYNQFDISMHNLYDYIKGAFQDESSQIKENISERISNLSYDLSNDFDKKLQIVQEQTSLRLVDIEKLADMAYQQASGIQTAFDQEQDKITTLLVDVRYAVDQETIAVNAKLKELDDLLQNSFTNLSTRYSDWQKSIKGKLDNKQEELDNLYQQKIAFLKEHWEKFEKEVADTSLRVASELEQGFIEHKEEIQDHEKDLQVKMELFRHDIAQGLKKGCQDLEGNREELLIKLSAERDIIRQELNQMSNDFVKARNEAYSLAEVSGQTIFEEIQTRVNDEMKHLDQEIVNGVEAMRNLIAHETEGTQKLAESLSDRYQSVESDLLGKIEEAEIFYGESFAELRSKQERLISLDEEWHLSFEGLQLKLEDDVAGVISDWRLRADNIFENEIVNESVRYKDSLEGVISNLNERVNSSVNNVEDLEILFRQYRENLELQKRDHQLYIEEYISGWQKEFEVAKESLERKGETLFLKCSEDSRQVCQKWQEEIDQWQLNTQEMSASVNRQFAEVELRVVALDEQWRENFVHTQEEWGNLWTNWKTDQNSLMQIQEQQSKESFSELQGLAQIFRLEIYQLKENLNFESENMQTQLRENLEKVEQNLYGRVEELHQEVQDRIQGMETTFSQNENKWNDFEQDFVLGIESKKQGLYEKINEKNQEIEGFVQEKFQDWKDAENKINVHLETQKEIIEKDFFKYQENFNQQSQQFKDVIEKELQQGYKFLEENRQDLIMKFSTERDCVRKELVNVTKDFAKAREEVHAIAEASEQKIFEEIRIRVQDEMKYLDQDISEKIEEMKQRISDGAGNIETITESLNNRCEHMEHGLLAKIGELEGFYTELFGDLRFRQEGLIKLDEEWKQGFEDLKVKLEDDMSHALQRWHENSDKNFNQEIANERLRYKDGLEQVVVTLNQSVDISKDKLGNLETLLNKYRDGLEERKREQDLYIESYIASWSTEFETEKVRFQVESQTLFAEYSKDSREVSENWKDEIEHWRMHVLEIRNSLERQFEEVQSSIIEVDQQWKLSFLSTQEGWQDSWGNWQQDQKTLMESEYQKNVGSFVELHELSESFRNQMHGLSQDFANQADSVQVQLRESVNQVESEWYSRVDVLKQELQDRVKDIEQHLETWKNIDSTIHHHVEYQKQLIGNSLLQCQEQLEAYEIHVQTLLTQQEKELVLNTSSFREEFSGQLSDVKSDIYSKISLIKQDLKSNLQRFDQDFTQRLANAEQIGRHCSENVEKLFTEVKTEVEQNSQNLLMEVKVHQEKWNSLQDVLNEDFDSYKIDTHGKITAFQNILNEEIVQKMEWADDQYKIINEKAETLEKRFVEDFERLVISNQEECDQYKVHWKADILQLDEQVQKHLVQTQNLSERYNHDLQNKFDELTSAITQYDETFVKTLEKQNQTWSEQILDWQKKVSTVDDHLNNYQDELKSQIDQRIQACHENVSVTLQGEEESLEKAKQHLHNKVQEFQKEFNENLKQISFGFTTHYNTLKQEIQDKFTIVDSMFEGFKNSCSEKISILESEYRDHQDRAEQCAKDLDLVWKNRFTELEKNWETQCNDFNHKCNTWMNIGEDKIAQYMQEVQAKWSIFLDKFNTLDAQRKEDIQKQHEILMQDWEDKKHALAMDFTSHIKNSRLAFDDNFGHIEAEWSQKISEATLDLENKLQGFSQGITSNVEGIELLIVEKEVHWNTRAEVLDANIKTCEITIGEKIQSLDRYKDLVDTHLETSQVEIQNYIVVQSQEFKQQIADNLSSFEKNVQEDWHQNLQGMKNQFLEDMKKFDMEVVRCEVVRGELDKGKSNFLSHLQSLTHEADTFFSDSKKWLENQTQGVEIHCKSFEQQWKDNFEKLSESFAQEQQNLDNIKTSFKSNLLEFDAQSAQQIQDLVSRGETFSQQLSQQKDILLQNFAEGFEHFEKGKEEICLKITHYQHELDKHWDQYSQDFDVQAQLVITQQKEWVDQKQKRLESLFASAAESFLILKSEYENRIPQYFNDLNLEVQNLKNAHDVSQVEVKQLYKSGFDLMQTLTAETENYVERQRDYIQKQEEDFHGEWKSLLANLSDQQQKFEQQWLQSIDTWYSQELDLSKLQDVFDQKSDWYIKSLIESMENKSQDVFIQYENQLVLELKNKQQKFLDTQIHLEQDRESLEKLYNDSLKNISNLSQQYETYLEDRRFSVQEREQDILARYEQFFESTSQSKTQLEAEHAHYFEVMRNSKDEFDIVKGEIIDKYTEYLSENLDIQLQSFVHTGEKQAKDFSEAYNIQRKNLDKILDFNQIVFRDLESGKQVFDKQQQTWKNLTNEFSKNADSLKKSCAEKIENMTLEQDNFKKKYGALLVQGEGEARIILEKMQEFLANSNTLSLKFQDKIQIIESEVQEYIKNSTEHVAKIFYDQENSMITDIEEHKQKMFAQNKEHFDQMSINFQEFIEEQKNSLVLNLDYSDLQEKQSEKLLELENLLTDSQGTIDQCVDDAREEMTYKLQNIDTFLEEFDQKLDQGFEKINVYQQRLDQYFNQESERGKESLKNYLSQFEKQLDLYFKDTVEKFHEIDTKLEQEQIVFQNTLNSKLEKSDKLVQDTENRLFEVKQNIESYADKLELQQKSWRQEFIEKIAYTDTQIQKQIQDLGYNIGKFEKDFSERRENLDQNLRQEQEVFQRCLDKVQSEIDQNRQQLFLQQDFLKENINNLEKEMEKHFESSKEQLIEKFDQKVLENEIFLLQNISEKTRKSEEKLQIVTDNVMRFEQELDSRMANYYEQIKDNFTKIEQVVATSEHQLQHYEKEIEDSRLTLESRMLVLRDNTMRELANSFEELKSIISGSVHETHEQMCIEFMTQLEGRLHEYEGSIQSKMQRLGILLDEFDSLESNLKSSIDDTSQHITENMKELEQNLTFKHQKEADRIAIVLNETNALIPDLQIQIDFIREQTLIIVRDKLISFEKEFMHDVEEKENQVTHYIEEWQQSVEKILKDTAKQSRIDQEMLEKTLEKETESYLKNFRNQTEEEMAECQQRMGTFITELNIRLGQIEDDVMTLYQDFSTRTKKTLTQESEQRDKYLLTSQKDIMEQLSNSKQDIGLELQIISQHLSKEKTNFINMIDAYRNDCIVWQSNSQEELKNKGIRLTEDFVEFRDRLYKEFKDLSVDIVQTKEGITERLQNEMQEVSIQFSDQNRIFFEFFESKKDYLEQTLNDLTQKVNETANGFDDKIASVIYNLESISEKTVTQVEQYKIEIEKDVTQQFEHVRMEVDQLREHVTDLREQAEQSIESRTEIIVKQLSEIETKQKGIEGSLDVLGHVNEIREKFERSLEGLSLRIKDVDEKWDKIIEFEGELNRALRMNDELSASLTTLTQERRKVETLDQKMRDAVELTGIVERKMSKLTEFSHGIEDIYVRLKELAIKESDLHIQFDQLGNKMLLANETAKSVDSSFEKMQILDNSLQQTFAEISDVKSSLDGVRTGIQMLDSQKIHIENFNNLIMGIDKKINDMESRITRIDEMREWIVQAENRMIDLQKNLKSNLRMTAISRDPETSSSEIGDRDTVIDTIIKLARQGWSSEQIASQLKISVGQVTLVIDRWGGQ